MNTPNDSVTLRLPVTPWPGAPLPDSPIVLAAGVVHEGDFLIWQIPHASRARLPQEFAVRDLVKLDCTDVEAVIRFVSDSAPILRRPVLPAIGLPRFHGPAAREPYPELPREIVPGEDWTSVAEVRDMVEVGRTLALHCLEEFKPEGGDVFAPWAAVERFDAERDATVFTDAEGNANWTYRGNTPWALFCDWLNLGLEAYSPRLDYVDESFGREFDAGQRPADLFSAVCLQLFNIINRRIPARRCENESCPLPEGLFFLQDPTDAPSGRQWTKGVRYCSVKCGNAQRSREARRRRREASTA